MHKHSFFCFQFLLGAICTSQEKLKTNAYAKFCLTSSLLFNYHNHIFSETHKGLKHVTRVQCSWIFTFTIFGNLSERYPFSTKWLPRDHHAGVLRRVLHFRVKNTPLKDKKWKEKVQKNAQLSFCGGREAFHQEIVLRGIQPCFLHDGAHGLFWNATKAVKFLLNFEVHFALYGKDNYVFEREFMYF